MRVDGELTQCWVYQNQLKPIAELNADNEVVSTFVCGESGLVPSYMTKHGVTYRVVSDRLGSVRLVVAVARQGASE